MKSKKYFATLAFLCLGALTLFLGGCGKKDDSSTAIAITPTPSDATATPTASPSATPDVSANTTTGVSANANGTSSSFAASSNLMTNNGISSNSTDGANKITGTIVAASMEDVTVRTPEGTEYTCSTANAMNNLSDGITLGNNITVTLASMSAVNGFYTATELNDISSTQAGSQNMGTDQNATDATLNEGIYDNDTTIDNNQYTDGVYDDGTYTDYTDTSGVYDDSTVYDDGSGGDYYYYDPSSEVYDESYAY